MSATLTVGGVAYTMIEDTFDLTNSIGERQRLKCDVIDYAGTAHFVKGEQVVVTDPALGTIFSGYLYTDKEYPQYPSGAILHEMDCIDQHYLADKRTYTRTYSTSTYAGKIAGDMLHDVLLAEGVNQNFAVHFDSTITDFNQGIISGTSSVQTVGAATGDGDLELATAGSTVTITEATTSDFSSGTLTNMVAANNTLSPSTVSGLMMSAILPYSATASSIIINFWSGSKALGTNDTLSYDIWVSSTSPAITATVGLAFTDGTVTTLIKDQNGLAIDSSTDLSAYAKDQWYTRSFSTTTYNGKTVASVWVGFGGSSQGTYTAWIKNVRLTSDPSHPFFSTTATTTQLSPVVVVSAINYLASSAEATVAPVFTPTGSVRTSTAYSIDAVKLLRSSLVSWSASTPGNTTFVLKASYDGGTTYQPCANNAALPVLPTGSNVAGLSITLQESFGAGSDPSVLPSLNQVTVSLVSAPNATKSDIVTTFATQANWNTGTYSGTQSLVSGDLTSGSISRDWNDNLITNQTFYSTGPGISQAASSGKYRITIPVSTSVNEEALSRLDFAGTLISFTLDLDVSIPSTVNFSSMLIIAYRQTYWTSGTLLGWGTGGYMLQVHQTGGSICRVLKGTNSATDTVGTAIDGGGVFGPTHVKIVCNGSHHQIYFNNSTTATFDFNDSTFASGQIGVGGFTFLQGSTASGTFTYDNLVATPNPVGTWTGPATSISSLGTCGPSVISWTEVNTGNTTQGAVTVQTSVDGGSTYQTCANGGSIPNIPSGTNVSGKSVQLLITLTTAGVTLLPIIRQLVWRVLGAYPGSSGTRSTVPLGNDTMVRSNVVGGFGTGFDSQTYTKVGTGTIALTSNEATIANTTGDVHMVYGSRTWTDEEGTVRFSLSASTISAGIELRYQDTNDFYRLSASTTTLTLTKKAGSITTTVATASITITTSTYYRMRFRVVGSSPVNLYGRVWADGVLEPTAWQVSGNG